MNNQNKINDLINEIKSWGLTEKDTEDVIRQEVAILNGATVADLQVDEIKRNGCLETGSIPCDILDSMLIDLI